MIGGKVRSAAEHRADPRRHADQRSIHRQLAYASQGRLAAHLWKQRCAMHPNLALVAGPKGRPARGTRPVHGRNRARAQGDGVISPGRAARYACRAVNVSYQGGRQKVIGAANRRNRRLQKDDRRGPESRRERLHPRREKLPDDTLEAPNIAFSDYGVWAS